MSGGFAVAVAVLGDGLGFLEEWPLRCGGRIWGGVVGGYDGGTIAVEHLMMTERLERERDLRER